MMLKISFQSVNSFIVYKSFRFNMSVFLKMSDRDKIPCFVTDIHEENP